MILVTGADGFVGRNLVRRLLDRSLSVRGLLLPGHPAPFEHPRLEWHRGDVRDRASVERALKGASTTVHLAAVVASPDETLNQDVNAEGTRTLVQLCRVHRCGRFMFMSAAAAKFKSPNAYGRSKFQAEKIVRSSGLDFAIVRTPLIIGAGGDEWERFVAFVREMPIAIPVFGDGTAIKRPVFIGDVVDAVERILARGVLGNRIWEIATRERITLNDLIDLTLTGLSMRKIKVHIPLALALAMARLSETLRGEKSPVTRDIVMGLNENVDFDIERDLADLGLDPMPVAEAIDSAIRARESGAMPS